MIFLTVGSMLPFDRLVTAIDRLAGQGLIGDDVYAQIGNTDYVPNNIEYVKSLDRVEYSKIFNNAKSIISHAGIGTISMALKSKKPLLVVPRLKNYNEIVNDHQVKTANRFYEEGYILKADSTCEIEKILSTLSSFKPRLRVNDAIIIEKKINAFIKKYVKT